MESGETKTAVLGVVVLIALAMGAWLVLAPRARPTEQSFGRGGAEPSAQNGRRSEILEIAGRGARLSDGEKKRLFEYLSGEQFREYQFSDRERALILKAIGG